MLIFAVSCILFGGVAVLFLQAYFFYIYFLKDAPAAKDSEEPNLVPCQLPEELWTYLKDPKRKSDKETCIALNLVFQFLFREWKDTKQMKRWFMKKLSGEFLEMQQSAPGRLLENITVRDLQLGKDLPIIKNVFIEDVVLNDSRKTMEVLDLCLELDYSGGFQLAVDVNMVLGRSASLAVTVTKMLGRARLELNRKPFSHWSLTFMEEPVVEFAVDSQFQGRQLPQITSLIINQIRRSLRKKHTLPHYKIRFRPMLPSPSFPMDVVEDRKCNRDLLAGTLYVTVLECSRLHLNKGSAPVFCTLAIDSRPWIESVRSPRASWATCKLEVHRPKNQSLGILFKQEFVEDRYENCVVIETVTPGSAAAMSGLKKSDVIIFVEGTKVNNTKHAIKLFKGAKEKFSITVERRIPKSPEKTSDSPSDSPQQRKKSAEMKPENDPISYESQPTENYQIKVPSPTNDGSPSPKNDYQSKSKNELLKVANNSSPSKNKTSSMVPEFKKTSLVYSTEDVHWGEKFAFDVESTHSYLNIGIWCRITPKSSPSKTSDTKTEDVLLGHASIAVLSILENCEFTTQGTHLEVFRLLPPSSWVLDRKWQKLSSHRGFDHRLCCGDITLFFQHKEPSSSKRNHSGSQQNARIEAEMFADVVLADSSKTLQTLQQGSQSKPYPSPSKKSLLDSHTPESTQDSDDESYTLEENKLNMGHDFISTQFHSAAICNFCKKKIWLKLAFQCRSCAMICHKKCIARCQLETACTQKGPVILQHEPPSTRSSSDSGTTSPDFGGNDISPGKASSPPSVSPCHGGNQADGSSPRSCRKNLNSLFSNLAIAAQRKGSLPRTGSVHNLAPPSSGLNPVSKSLPPSPHHSPAQSRKCSLQETPYSWLDSSVLEEEDITRTLELMMTFPHDDTMLAVAKEKGRDLYVQLEPYERLERINIMICRLQEAMDAEAETRNHLVQDEKSTVSPTKKTKLAFLIAKCDERSQALATLMLLYVSGLQHCTSSVPAEFTQISAHQSNDPSRHCSPKLILKANSDISITAPSPISEGTDVEIFDVEEVLTFRVPNEVQMGIATVVGKEIKTWEEPAVQANSWSVDTVRVPGNISDKNN